MYGAPNATPIYHGFYDKKQQRETHMNWLKVMNLSGDPGKDRKATLWIDGPIGMKDWMNDSGTVAAEFVRTVDAMGELTDIDVLINTPGGVISDGVTITNYLINHAASVGVTVMGQAASIGSVIAQAADPGRLHMALGSTMFVHDPITAIAGNSTDMRWVADRLDKLRDSIITIYQRRTTMPVDEIKQLMADESTMTAEEAVANGFADSMDAELKAVAYHDPHDVFAIARATSKQFLQPSGATGHNSGGHIMPVDKDPVAKLPEINIEYLRQNHAQLIDTITDDARNTGATNERERIQSVLAQSLPGHEKLIETLAFDGKTSGPEAAVQILQAEKAATAKRGENIKADAAELNKVAQTADAGTGSDDLSQLPIKEQCEARWKASADLRAEYGDNFDTYLAYAKNRDKVKILGSAK